MELLFIKRTNLSPSKRNWNIVVNGSEPEPNRPGTHHRAGDRFGSVRGVAARSSGSVRVGSRFGRTVRVEKKIGRASRARVMLNYTPQVPLFRASRAAVA